MSDADEFYRTAVKDLCHESHLYFSKYFFRQRHGTRFIDNWHHHLISDELEKVFKGETENLIINVAPGSSKTELVVINFIARGLALNPHSRFLHLSYSDDLALLNSQAAREIIRSDEFQALWPLEIASDTKAKKRWNVLVNSRLSGGVYATSLDGQVTGFRAGHMAQGFNGAIIIDDPLKPEDAYSRSKLESANRKLVTTVKSRKANPKTPIVIIMQRISDGDVSGFVQAGGLQGNWKTVIIPALIDDAYIQEYAPNYAGLINSTARDDKGRFSYWEYKEPVADLNAMESGQGIDQMGNQISRHVFSSQYQQKPTRIGGNIIKGEHFVRYSILPQLKYRMIYADTAQKTAERNDFSVFQCWGHGYDHKIYLLDQIRGKWESPELLRRARAFWAKHKGTADERMGNLRKIKIEDKSSGTGLIQHLKTGDNDHSPVPVEGIERNKDKFTRVNDGLPYIEAHMVCIPLDAPFTNDYIAEHEAFTANDTHLHDDQIDPTLDAVDDMLSTNNKLKLWERLA